MKLYKILSLLLEYPEEALITHIPEIRQWVQTSPELDAQEMQKMNDFLDYLEDHDLLALQANYVSTFDMNAAHSLHLTHHLFGDDKNRGPALIDLGELYKDYGVQIADGVNELPDYLPLILEFAAYLDSNEATVFLSDANKVFQILTDNLREAESPYAALISIIAKRASLTRIEAA